MSELSIAQLEKFILASDKMQALKEITPYTSNYYFLELLIEFANPSRPESELDSLVENFLKNLNSPEDQKNFVKLKHRLKKISAFKHNEEELKKWLEKFNKDFLNLGFDFQNPVKNSQLGELKREEGTARPKSRLSQEELKELELSSALERIYKEKSYDELIKIRPEFSDRFDLDRFDFGKDQIVIEHIFSNYRSVKNINRIPRLVDFLLKFKENCKGESLIKNTIWPILGLQNKERLLKDAALSYDEQLQTEFAAVKFDLSKTQDERRPAKERIEEWRKLRAHFLSLPSKFQKYQSFSLLKVLQLKAEIGEFDEPLFLEYLRNPWGDKIRQLKQEAKEKQAVYLKKLSKSRKEDEHRQDQNSLILLFFIDNVDQNKLVERYLKFIFSKAKDYEPYLEFFEEAHLKKMFFACKLFCGENVEQINEIFSPNELQAIHSKRLLNLEGNQRRFEGNERVSLRLELKNIEKLSVRVFEVNTLNFLRENNNESFEGIDLTGLLPSEEYLYSYSHSPVRIHCEEFSFLTIADKGQGVFIVDFTGHELNARAVVYKGGLTLVNDAQTGRNCLLLDQEGKICRGAETGFFVENTFFAANQASGVVSVPLNIAAFSKPVIAVHDGFACLCPLRIEDPQPELLLNVLYNAESLLAGNQVELVVQAKLTLNGQACAVDRLTNSMVTVSVTSVEGLKNNSTFKDLKLKQNEDTVVNLIFPQKAKIVVVNLTSEILIADKTRNLSASYQLELEEELGAEIQRAYFRKNERGDLTLEVLGRNGEPIKNASVQGNIELTFKSESKSFELFTDENGKVNFGKIDFLVKINAHGIFGDLYFAQEKQKGDIFPANIQILEKEEVTLPLPSNAGNLALLQLSENSTIREDLTESCLTKQDGCLSIKNLTEGNYMLFFAEQEIKIIVFKGNYFALNGQNIKTSDFILPVSDKEKFFSAKISDNSDNKLKVTLEGPLENARAHLLLFNFVPNEIESLKQLVQTFSSVGTSQTPREPFPILKKENLYKSDKRLSDELIYVSQRQDKQNYMGNTLEKPGILLKRNRIGETTETEQTINEGADYAKADGTYPSAYLQQNFYTGKMAQQEMYHDYYNSPEHRQNSARVLNFLKNPGKIISNIKLSESKEFELDGATLQQFSFGVLALTNGDLVSLVELPWNDSVIEKADCRLAEPKTQGFVYEHQRKVSGAVKGQKFAVKNIKNTELCIIDSMANLFDILQLIQNQNEAELKEWEFLKKWNVLEPMEKLKKYDKYASHELNIFLFNKDKEFFESVVRPFIENKKEKQVVDYFLLDDKENIKKFFDFNSFAKLNKLELCLLAQISKNLNPEFSNSILKYFKSKSILQKRPEKERNLIFDSLICSQGEKIKTEEVVVTAFDECAPVACGLSMGYSARLMDRRPEECERTEGRRNLRHLLPNKKAKVQKKASSDEECEEAYDDDDHSYLEDERGYLSQDLRANINVFVPLQGTIEYNERQYWLPSLTPDLDPFWLELAAHLASSGSADSFLPEDFIYSCRNFSDCVCALSFVDLPFEKTKFESSAHAQDLLISPATNLIVLTKEVIQRQGEPAEYNVLCAQGFFDPNDRFLYDEEDPSLRVDKPVREFVAGKAYGSRVVVTNSTGSDLNLSVAFEIPQGAIPVAAADGFQMHARLVGSLQSEVFEFQFYFPETGAFAMYPATVAKGGRLVASATIPPRFEVKAQASPAKLETMSDVLSLGNVSDVLEFVQTKNILNPNIFSFSDVYWLLKNKAFYTKFVEIMRAKGALDETALSFSLYHADLPTLAEFLKVKADQGCFSFARFVKSELLAVDTFETREYYPLINPRAYSLGTEKANIINNAFKATYTGFLLYLLQKGQQSAEDLLQLAGYLIAQDRFEEAAAVFERVTNCAPQSNPATRIQRDYLAAYIDFVRGYPDFSTAKRICGEYLTYPVLSWRNLFVEMANQLAEFEESALIEGQTGQEAKALSNAEKASKAPGFTAELDGPRIKVLFQNAASLKAEYYKVDFETLFTLNPFSLDKYKNYGHVKPFLLEKIELVRPEEGNLQVHAIPLELTKENLFIQLSLQEKGISQTAFLSYLPFALQLQLNEEFGILKLIDGHSKKPVPKVYVKCFVKYKSGKVAFYKDGYTDLRGSFDYVSLSKDNLGEVERFSLMVNGAEFGFKAVEVLPPKTIGRVEGEAKKLVSQNWANIQKKNICREGISKYERMI